MRSFILFGILLSVTGCMFSPRIGVQSQAKGFRIVYSDSVSSYEGAWCAGDKTFYALCPDEYFCNAEIARFTPTSSTSGYRRDVVLTVKDAYHFNISDNASTLLVGHGSPVTAYNTRSGKQTLRLDIKKDQPSVLFLPRGKTFVTGEGTGAGVWDARSGLKIATLLTPGFPGAVHVSISPWKDIIVCNLSSGLYAFSPTTWQRTQPQWLGTVDAVSYLHKKQQLVVATAWMGTVMLVNRQGHVVAQTPKLADRVRAVATTADDKFIIVACGSRSTAGSDFRILLMDVDDLQVVDEMKCRGFVFYLCANDKRTSFLACGKGFTYILDLLNKEPPQSQGTGATARRDLPL
jgi:hypothetical protein